MTNEYCYSDDNNINFKAMKNYNSSKTYYYPLTFTRVSIKYDDWLDNTIYYEPIHDSNTYSAIKDI
jgi:hypothetical protein